MLKYLIAFLLVSASLSILLSPEEMAELYVKESHLLNTHLKTQDSPSDSSSSAAPVQGLANATSGYLSVNDPKTNSKLFYIFYSCRGLTPKQSATDVPILVWLQGGPGSTSQLGNFLEFGPYSLTFDKATGKYKESRNALSWNDHYNLLIIDNPRGTGYSIADKESYVTTEDQVGDDFLQAMLNFYGLKDFAAFSKTPLYIFGESYAGHYIPAVSKRIVESNIEGKNPKIPLSGIAIGNGFVDPVNQLADNSLFAYTLGLVDTVQKAKMDAFALTGINNINNKKWLAAKENFSQIMSTIRTASGDVNIYNFRIFGNYDFNSLVTFFNDADTVKRYNVDPSVAGHFQSSNTDVYSHLSEDFMQSCADRVAFVANSGLPVMIFNGQDDIICNTATVHNWVDKLVWRGQTKLHDTPLNPWKYSNGTIVGAQKTYNNFSFVVVNKAGHLVPMDQIETSIEMVKRFVAGQTNWTQPYAQAEVKVQSIEL